MKELQYPFDANYILTKKKNIRRRLLEDKCGRIEKKIAILGGYTTNNIKLILELFLLNYGIKPEFYESEYNQYYEDAIFDNPELKEFKPDIIYVCTSNHNIIQYPTMQDNADAIEEMISTEVKKYKQIWNSLKEKYNCPIIQNNFEMPYYRLLGNKDASDIHGKVNFLTRLNMEFYAYAQTSKDFFICDINYISADYGLKEWADPFYYHMYKYALNVNAIPYLAYNVANIIKSIFGKNKKGFVLDLDNTLWGGIIGDDGVDNIVLGPETSEGQVYSEFQRYIKEHTQLGVILNINSKNDEENALLGLTHPDSVLKKDDIIVLKANWDSKDRNFRQIADELNLLPESLLFIDDNPAERHIVTQQLEGVVAPEIGEVYQYIYNIDRGGYFETTSISNDDAKRNEMYKANARRAEAEASFSDYKEYLLSLDMRAVIKEFEPLYMARISQLSNKSNQFNLTTRRYTQAEIEEIANDNSYITVYGKLIDKFGDNGVVSVAIGHIVEDECQIDLWIMSCRVLKRDMEYAMMDKMIAKCVERGIYKVHGFYYPTAKNSMVKEFYSMQGFDKIAEDENGNTEWIYNIPEQYIKKNTVIKMEEENE